MNHMREVWHVLQLIPVRVWLAVLRRMLPIHKLAYNVFQQGGGQILFRAAREVRSMLELLHYMHDDLEAAFPEVVALAEELCGDCPSLALMRKAEAAYVCDPTVKEAVMLASVRPARLAAQKAAAVAAEADAAAEAAVAAATGGRGRRRGQAALGAAATATGGRGRGRGRGQVAVAAAPAGAATAAAPATGGRGMGRGQGDRRSRLATMNPNPLGPGAAGAAEAPPPLPPPQPPPQPPQPPRPHGPLLQEPLERVPDSAYPILFLTNEARDAHRAVLQAQADAKHARRKSKAAAAARGGTGGQRQQQHDVEAEAEDVEVEEEEEEAIHPQVFFFANGDVEVVDDRAVWGAGVGGAVPADQVATPPAVEVARALLKELEGLQHTTVEANVKPEHMEIMADSRYKGEPRFLTPHAGGELTREELLAALIRLSKVFLHRQIEYLKEILRPFEREHPWRIAGFWQPGVVSGDEGDGFRRFQEDCHLSSDVVCGRQCPERCPLCARGVPKLSVEQYRQQFEGTMGFFELPWLQAALEEAAGWDGLLVVDEGGIGGYSLGPPLDAWHKAFLFPSIHSLFT